MIGTLECVMEIARSSRRLEQVTVVIRLECEMERARSSRRLGQVTVGVMKDGPRAQPARKQF